MPKQSQGNPCFLSRPKGSAAQSAQLQPLSCLSLRRCSVLLLLLFFLSSDTVSL